METENILVKMEKVNSNNRKLDDVISNLENCTGKLIAKRNELKEETAKLNEQVVGINNDISNSRQIKVMLEQEIKTKSQEIMVVAKELEELKWQNTWHDIIAENQAAELKVNYDKIEVLKSRKRDSETVRGPNGNCIINNQVDNEIKETLNENKLLKQQIFQLKKNLMTQSAINETEKEISLLQDRNDKILKRMKCQLAQLENRNAQDYAYLKSLQKEMEHSGM